MKYTHIYTIITLIALLIIRPVFGQETKKQSLTDANITGHAIDKNTNEHLPYVTIKIKGTSIGTVTDASGHFFLKHLPEGELTVVASFLGYKAEEKMVTTINKKTIDISFELEEDVLTVDEFVVTSSRNEVQRKESSTIVTLVSPKLIETTLSNNMSEVLNYQPGLRVEFNCQNCGLPQLRINGLEGQYSQILMDGRPLFSSLASVYALEQLPVGMIERAEIVRGGGSALYGSSAIGGVVNIITKEPVRNSILVSSTLDLIKGVSPDVNTTVNASLLTNNSKAGIFIFGVLRNRSPYDNNDDGFSEIPKLNGKTIGFRGFYRTGYYSKIILEYHHGSEFRRGGNKIDEPPHQADIAEQLEHEIDAGSISYDWFSRNTKHHIVSFASTQHITRKSYFGTEQDLNAYGKSKDMTLNTGLQYNYSMKRFLFMPSELSAGLEYNFNQLEDIMLGYNRDVLQKVYIAGSFIQNEWKNKQLTISTGLRLDKHSMMKKPVLSPRASIRYTPIEGIILRASYASGYRAPQAYQEDLHVAAVGGSVSLISIDANLKPEYSHSLNASIDWTKKFNFMQAGILLEGFFARLNDIFILEENGFDQQGHLLLLRKNAQDGAMVAGLNVEARWMYKKMLYLTVSYTFQNSRYLKPQLWSKEESLNAQKRMFRTPDHYGFLTLEYNIIKNLKANLSAIYTGSMLVQHFAGYIDKDTEITTKSFLDMGINASYTFNLHSTMNIVFTLGMKNIFNSYQKDFDLGKDRDSGYIYGTATPRTYIFGLKFEL
ncbi:MAG: TonB-dependent receptor [Bacteroidales bacterium]|jgi:outer membrane receptor for ferrienterochelin and colicins|nr:TonB-dependent receptor [Bacteroidales bacterium]